ncbi:MAG TPA: hypothetical protein VFL66_10015 [Gaiellaceae bacterium]|nr:hypothetical protein [Gaiellaceae bacterium]
MSSVARGAVFDALLAAAKARVVDQVEARSLARADGEFLLRALIDLESDGVLLFGPERAADAEFYAAVTEYLVARAGPVAADAALLAPVSQLVGHAGDSPRAGELDRAVLQLITH